VSFHAADALAIPGFAPSFCPELSPDILALRDKALALHRGPERSLVDRELIDARSWAAHTEDEHWLIWRARCVAERLKQMPIHVEPGERIVGKPLFRRPEPDEIPKLEEARSVLAAMPPCPGGDLGHFHPDYEKLFRVGIGGIVADIGRRRRAAGATAEQGVFYEACRIAMEGMSAYVRRTRDSCEAMADMDKENEASWRKLAEVCGRIATEPPATFHEAIQLMFLAQIALWFGEDHIFASPGRMDQTLRRFYEADLADGRITGRGAFELICCHYIQMNRVLWPGRAVAVMVGGRDHAGGDVTNELTYLCLAARLATRLVYPTVGLAWHEGTPEELMDFAVHMLGTGVGCPAFFNDHVITRGLRDHGVSEADSYNYMNSTCVEIKVAGASNIWVTSPYFNCPQALLELMARVAEGAVAEPETFEDFADGVRQNLAGRIREAARRMDAIWQERAHTGCFPLASCVVRDCLVRGRDFDRGGARYNWVENSFVGLANLVDGLIAIKHMVYNRREFSLADFHRILERNFEGHEGLRQRILNTLPTYGNNDDEADGLAKEWAEFLIASTESNTVGPHCYVPGFFCWVVHERFGAETGATPDGRPAGWPLADGAGAAQGREKRGPTASVLSTTRWSHRKVLGGLVHNVKFSRSFFQTDRGRKAVRDLIETYLKRGGFEIQANVVGKDDLLEAQEHPERHPDLLVRVAGYSDYFVQLNRSMQNEVIARTEHSPD